MGGFSSSREISLAKASHLFGELPLEFQLNLALLPCFTLTLTEQQTVERGPLSTG